MTSIIEISQYILILSVGFLIAYQMLWSILALKGKKIENFKTSKSRKFAVVLVANNGQPIVSKSLYSLSGLVYPKNLYDLIVIAERNTDDFAKTAQDLGAVVFEVNRETTKRKQNIFDLIFDKLRSLNESYEALIIFDANSLVSGNYLEVMNYYLENGNEIIQSSSLIIPDSNKRGNKAACVDFLLDNYVKPLGKKTMGIGLIPRNNGTCFAFDVLKHMSTNPEISNSDVHLGFMLQFKNLHIAFAPEARVFIESPLNSSVNNHQQSGYENIKEQLSKLWEGLHENQKVRFLDSFLELMTPSMANMITVVIVMFVTNLVLWFYEVTAASFIGLWGAMGLLGLLHLFIGLKVAGSNRKLYTVISYLPSHILAKLSGSLKWGAEQNGKQQLTKKKLAENEDLVPDS